MVIAWLRRSFIGRRWVNRFSLDLPDFILRAFTGRLHWPPYSLRAFVGGANFDTVGHWFLEEFRGLGLLQERGRILDIGCGCGRIAFALAMDAAVRKLEIEYDGMDIDRANIQWCQRHITPRNASFRFYLADCASPSYNPHGQQAPTTYQFPFSDGKFDLILLISVFTHMLEDEMRQYLSEAARMLTPNGRVYATFFLFQNLDEVRDGLKRHAGWTFRHTCRNAAVSRLDYPNHAVAYLESFVRDMAFRSGLRVIEPTRYGSQDLLLFERH
ncbi:MAG: class I SAM-dependent methyltransferase [Bryobacteraceae bacterium]|jgi:SAM-dependent methyltransferase